MAIREVQEIVFNNMSEYLDWMAIQQKDHTGVKVCGLSEFDGNKIKAQYIELF
jgi:hypothetical protein